MNQMKKVTDLLGRLVKSEFTGKGSDNAPPHSLEKLHLFILVRTQWFLWCKCKLHVATIKY